MQKPIQLIDAQAARVLRQVLMDRNARIDALYPEVGSQERTEALQDLIHLVHEMGLDCEGLLYGEGE